MDKAKNSRFLSAAILIALVVIFTIYRMNSGSEPIATVGIDDEKIGIAYDGEATFIENDQVVSVETADDLSEVTGAYTLLCGDSDELYIVINTNDGSYVTNSGSAKATRQTYEEIMEKLNFK